MKKIAKGIFLLFMLCAMLFVSCAGSAEAASNESVALSGGIASNEAGTAEQWSGGAGTDVLNEIEGKEWFLMELRSAGALPVRIDRSRIEASNIADSFTISFQEGRVSGMGWPNRYAGPYTVGSGDALSIGNLASTMMAAFVELEELREYDYFAYLSKVTRWAVRDGKLELYSTSDGRETVLVYEPR